MLVTATPSTPHHTRLSNSQGNLLDDTELIDVLAVTKQTAQDVSDKLANASETNKKINEACEEYRCGIIAAGCWLCVGSCWLTKETATHYRAVTHRHNSDARCSVTCGSSLCLLPPPRLPQPQPRPVAHRATLIYFLIAEFSVVNCMYQTSLAQFNELYELSIDHSEKASMPSKRIANVIEHMTYEIYLYIQVGWWPALLGCVGVD